MAVQSAQLAALFASVRAGREAVSASRERFAEVLDYRAVVLEQVAQATSDEAHSEQCLILAEQARSRAGMIRQDLPDQDR